MQNHALDEGANDPNAVQVGRGEDFTDNAGVTVASTSVDFHDINSVMKLHAPVIVESESHMCESRIDWCDGFVA